PPAPHPPPPVPPVPRPPPAPPLPPVLPPGVPGVLGVVGVVTRSEPDPPPLTAAMKTPSPTEAPTALRSLGKWPLDESEPSALSDPDPEAELPAAGPRLAKAS